ncbi:MAG: 30S ribosomal protein S13 [Chloroflexi bacterium]|nr:30S ribosomal protein S13 [Chloroflexota bacterium]
MALIAGVNIPDGKRVEIALRSIYGIGPSLAKKVVEEVSISGNPKVQDIDEGQLAQLRDVVEKSFTLEGDLRRQTQLNIRRKIDIRSYEGSRHVRGLPVHGQRSKTNARTRKGPKKTVAGRGK